MLLSSACLNVTVAMEDQIVQNTFQIKACVQTGECKAVVARTDYWTVGISVIK